jgi:hypothetical protein
LEASLDIPVLAAIPSSYELTKLSWELGATPKGRSRAQANEATIHPGSANGSGETEY